MTHSLLRLSMGSLLVLAVIIYFAISSQAVANPDATGSKKGDAASTASQTAGSENKPDTVAPSSPPATAEGKAEIKEAEKTTKTKICEFEITANDAMQFNTKELKIGADCTLLRITLKNIGKLPKVAMGHNLVIAEKSKTDALIKAGLQAGPTKDYIPNSPDVLAATKLLSGGEEDVLEVATSKLQGKDLNFFCLFPGHTAAMRGVIAFEKDPAKTTS